VALFEKYSKSTRGFVWKVQQGYVWLCLESTARVRVALFGKYSKGTRGLFVALFGKYSKGTSRFPPAVWVNKNGSLFFF